MTGTLAQLVEQRTENPCVPGSIPGGTTIKSPNKLFGFFGFITMEHFFYIIYSKSKDSFYVGESHNVSERLHKHIAHIYNPKSFTKIASDWEIAICHTCANKADALYLEKFIKRMKNKKFILKIIEDPNILKDILAKR